MLDADGAISDRLVSFKDVQELQTRNSELLMVIREVTAKQESSEAKLVEERTADLKKELDSVREQLEQLAEARRRQEALVENIVVQRDMYKTMVESQGEANTSMVNILSLILFPRFMGSIKCLDDLLPAIFDPILFKKGV